MSTLEGDISSLSGMTAGKIGFTDLSVSGPLTYNSGSGIFGFITGADGQILAMSGTSIVWKNPEAASNPVTTVFGRLGDITAQVGDYTTTQVTE